MKDTERNNMRCDADGAAVDAAAVSMRAAAALGGGGAVPAK